MQKQGVKLRAYSLMLTSFQMVLTVLGVLFLRIRALQSRARDERLTEPVHTIFIVCLLKEDTSWFKPEIGKTAKSFR